MKKYLIEILIMVLAIFGIDWLLIYLGITDESLSFFGVFSGAFLVVCVKGFLEEQRKKVNQ